jgi:acetyl-CoA carboxylase biotin carboxylase subunit
LRLAHDMGFPVLIKAAAGGGGRGMRVAHNDLSLKAGLKSAQQEAEKAFKDGSVYLEKYIEQPRHT